MAVRSFCLFLFSCEHFPVRSDFSQKQRLPMSPVRCRSGGRCAGVCTTAREFCCWPLQPLRSRVLGGFWRGLCLSAVGSLPAAASPVAPAAASVQGSAGARRKPLLQTSAVTLIVGLPFLILSARQQSAWRFVLSCLNLVNIVSKKLTKVTML